MRSRSRTLSHAHSAARLGDTVDAAAGAACRATSRPNCGKRGLRAPAALALVMLAWLAACAQEITADVPPPDLSSNAFADAYATCENLVAALPQSIGSASRVATSPKSPLTAAWAAKSSFVTLRCESGVRHVAGESLLTVDAIDWRVRDTAAATVLIAVDRRVSLEVTVPRAAGPAADYLVDLAPYLATLAPLAS